MYVRSFNEKDSPLCISSRTPVPYTRSHNKQFLWKSKRDLCERIVRCGAYIVPQSSHYYRAQETPYHGKMEEASFHRRYDRIISNLCQTYPHRAAVIRAETDHILQSHSRYPLLLSFGLILCCRSLQELSMVEYMNRALERIRQQQLHWEMHCAIFGNQTKGYDREE